MTKEERISNDTHAYWKSLDCTKALLFSLETSIEYLLDCISNRVMSESEINTTKLNQLKGNIDTLKEIQDTTLNKESLEKALITKEKENERP